MIEALDGYAVAQRLREDGQFVLLRARRTADGLPVLLLGARDGRRDSRERIEREFALRGDLDPSFAAMPLALADSSSGHVLVLADSGATPLSLLPRGPMPVHDFLPLALNISGALAQLHRRDIVHKDLRPEHILLDGASGRVQLTGFGSAARLGAVPRGPDGYQSGSLPYMAPEQTGRVNHPVDLRTDLYSFGVVLYQLLCGALPFAAGDAMQWIHCHVARAPRPCGSDIDPCVAAIVHKLLAKVPEQRYQSVAGLQADLAHCVALLQADGHSTPFELGRSDGARPRAAGMLVGRAAQLALLEESLRRVAAGGAADPLLISGPGGCGKSSLLDAFACSAADQGAHVVTVKFEQHLADTPYAALRAALPVRPGWRALAGSDAGLLAHVLPGLGRPARGGMAEEQGQARLRAVFRRLVASLGMPGAPALLCLDDLQWADAASVALLEAVAAPPALPNVLLVGTMRGAVQAPSLLRAIDSLTRQGTRTARMVLGPLAHADSNELVALALNCPAPSCAHLADMVFARCRGNPMFTLQFLIRLAECSLLRYERQGGRWEWDGPAIAAFKGAASLVELLAARLQQLPYQSLQVVKLMACLGRQTDATTLARVAGMSELEVDESLWPAERLGLVQRAPASLAFVHDRVRDVAASLVGRRGLPQRYLHIGQVLARGARGDTLFAAAAHLQRGCEAMQGADARLLARVGTAAGRRARAALAFDTARACYCMAADCTPEQAWDEAFERTFAMQLALAECEQRCGEPALAEARLAALDVRVAVPGLRMLRATVTLARLAGLRSMDCHPAAAQLGLAALSWFGLDFPEPDDAIEAAIAAERSAIAATEPAPHPASAEAAMVTALCAEVGPAVCAHRPRLYRLLAARALHYVLRHGSSEASCILYARYAVSLAAAGELDQAFTYARLAREGAPSPLRRARIDLLQAAFLDCWRDPLGQTVQRLEAAVQACQATGDLAHAGYAVNASLWHSLEAGMALSDVGARARSYQTLARQADREPLQALLQCHIELVNVLQDEGGPAAARAALERMQPAGDGATRTCCLVLRQAAAYLLGLHDEARAAANAVAGECTFVFGAVHEGSHRLFHALTLAALYDGSTARERPAMLETMRAIAAALQQQALRCATNFSGRYLLVAAELARIEGRDLDAMHSYDAALALARAGGLRHQEAMAADLAAHFYDTRGSYTSALAYAAEAWQAWRLWGSQARMRALEYRFPSLVRRDACAVSDVRDTDAALAMCQQLARSSSSTALADKLLRYAVRHSGASRGLLLLARDSGLRCVAQADAALEGLQVQALDLPLAAAPLPCAVPLMVQGSGGPVVIGDALANPQLAQDLFVQERRPRALLCVPLVSHGLTIGLLYLEHALVTAVFNERRVRLMELAASQAALVLERDRLLAELDLAWLRRQVEQEGCGGGADHSRLPARAYDAHQ